MKKQASILAAVVVILLSVFAVNTLAQEQVFIPIQSTPQDESSTAIDISLFQEKPSSDNQITARIMIRDDKVKYCVPASLDGKHRIVTTETAAFVTFEFSNRKEYRVYCKDTFDLIFTPRLSNEKYYSGKIKLDFYDANDQWVCSKTVLLIMDTLTGKYSAQYFNP